jgi:hypothetical protein
MAGDEDRGRVAFAGHAQHGRVDRSLRVVGDDVGLGLEPRLTGQSSPALGLALGGTVGLALALQGRGDVELRRGQPDRRGGRGDEVEGQPLLPDDQHDRVAPGQERGAFADRVLGGRGAVEGDEDGSGAAHGRSVPDAENVVVGVAEPREAMVAHGRDPVDGLELGQVLPSPKKENSLPTPLLVVRSERLRLVYQGRSQPREADL